MTKGARSRKGKVKKPSKGVRTRKGKKTYK